METWNESEVGMLGLESRGLRSTLMVIKEGYSNHTGLFYTVTLDKGWGRSFNLKTKLSVREAGGVGEFSLVVARAKCKKQTGGCQYLSA